MNLCNSEQGSPMLVQNNTIPSIAIRWVHLCEGVLAEVGQHKDTAALDLLLAVVDLWW